MSIANSNKTLFVKTDSGPDLVQEPTSLPTMGLNEFPWKEIASTHKRSNFLARERNRLGAGSYYNTLLLRDNTKIQSQTSSASSSFYFEFYIKKKL
jgi:hypothetical protein